MAIDTMLRTLISSIFAITFGITGIYLTVQYLRAKALSRQTSTWPRTEGKITASWVKNKIGTVRGTRAVIKYTYTVMGKTF